MDQNYVKDEKPMLPFHTDAYMLYKGGNEEEKQMSVARNQVKMLI